MHEAGLARALAARLRELGLTPGDARLVVRGGHHDPVQFDAALREHLQGELPGEDAARLEIVRRPVEHLCPACRTSFDAVGSDEPCPTCGGMTLSSMLDEQLEIERVTAS